MHRIQELCCPSGPEELEIKTKKSGRVVWVHSDCHHLVCSSASLVSLTSLFKNHMPCKGTIREASLMFWSVLDACWSSLCFDFLPWVHGTYHGELMREDFFDHWSLLPQAMPISHQEPTDHLISKALHLSELNSDWLLDCSFPGFLIDTTLKTIFFLKVNLKCHLWNLFYLNL